MFLSSLCLCSFSYVQSLQRVIMEVDGTLMAARSMERSKDPEKKNVRIFAVLMTDSAVATLYIP